MPFLERCSASLTRKVRECLNDSGNTDLFAVNMSSVRTTNAKWILNGELATDWLHRYISIRLIAFNKSFIKATLPALNRITLLAR